MNIANRIYPMKIERSSEENIRNAIKKIETRLKFYEENYAIKDKQDLVAMCLIEYASKLEYFNNKDIETDLTTRLEGINNILNDNI
ncbi:cell division protein ZapA [Flavobacteriales bacterium]|nr:cell division protein ZapA [Flavobacteriales bacterium]MDG1426164.1 cell division protein ZapA [Flavobacteriales bacterium]MDG2086460.1 cell division protein ZapA [Flavobacteriales bacterium]